MASDKRENVMIWNANWTQSWVCWNELKWKGCPSFRLVM